MCEQTESKKTDISGQSFYEATEIEDGRIIDMVEQIAGERGIPMAQVALTWVLCKRGVSAPIMVASEANQLDDAIAALDLSLTEGEINRLEAAIRTSRHYRLRLTSHSQIARVKKRNLKGSILCVQVWAAISCPTNNGIRSTHRAASFNFARSQAMDNGRSDQEIYEIANTVLGDITAGLAAGIYQELGGTLTFGWATEPRFNAWAESMTEPQGAPQHKIVLHYELARQLYRDAESFVAFAPDERVADFIQTSFKGDASDCLPSCFTAADCVHNMFCAAITWVYFHELGHLMQEHGNIREREGNQSSSRALHELDSHASHPLTGRASVVSHVTELAADFEATTLCLVEMAKHFLMGPLVDADDRADVYIAGLYLLACSLACIFYRFNSGSGVSAEPPITGSHPSPIYRLELSVPQLYELAEILVKGAGYEVNRRKLVSMTTQAADVGALFYNYALSTATDNSIDLFIKGLLQRPEFQSYTQEIVAVWDELSPEIVASRHFGLETGLMQFTDDFRRLVVNA